MPSCDIKGLHGEESAEQGTMMRVCRHVCACARVCVVLYVYMYVWSL